MIKKAKVLPKPLEKKPQQGEAKQVDLLINLGDRSKYPYTSRYIKMQAIAGVLFGWQSAAILENIRQWADFAKKNKDSYYYRNGYFWTRRSYDDLVRDHFGMMSLRTLKERVKYLEGIGVLVSQNFNKVYENSEGLTRKGQTKWYRIDEEATHHLARQFDEYIRKRINSFLGDGDPFINALTCVGQRITNGMGFVIYDFKEKKVGFAPDVIREYGSITSDKFPRKIKIQ